MIRFPLQFRASTSRTLHQKQSGFVLVATLALLGLAVVSVVVVTSLIRSQTDLIEAKTRQAISRQNALNALNIAIGQLQDSAGNDRTITVPAATSLVEDENGEESNLINPHWSQAISTTSGATTWLVSSPNSSTPDPLNAINTANRVDLVGQYTADPDDSTQWVTAEKVPLQTLANRYASSDQTTGHFAYWTGELNTRANIALTDRISTELNDPYSIAYNQLSLPRRSASESVLPDIANPDDSTTREKLSKIITPEQLFFLTEDREPLQQHYHDFTTFSRSILTNPIDGGLKINLTDPIYTDSIITPAIREQITPEYYTTEAPQNYQVQGDDQRQVFGISDIPADEEPLAIHQPIITEYSLSMGIFHTQSDRKDRVKFHMYIEWLNPYPYDLGFLNNKPYVIIADNLPTLEVTNISSGESYEVDLNHYDPDFRYNNNSKTKINSWMTFDALSDRSNEFRYGIDSGEVYRMSEPNHVTDEDGLTRTVQEKDDVWQWDASGPPAIGPRPANKIYPTDQINIRSTTSVKMNLTIIPMSGSNRIPSDMTPDEFAATKGYVQKFINIPFDDIEINLNGGSYSRSTSTSFTPADYRLAFHFRLKADRETLQRISTTHSLRNPILDFNDSEVRGLFEIGDVVAAARTVDPASNQLDELGNHQKFWDDSHRENGSVSGSEQYQFHLFDVPILEPLSPGVFSQLHFHGRPHSWVGSPLAASSPLNEVYDRYYFSGSIVSDDWAQHPQSWVVNAPEAGLLANHRIRPVLQPDNRFPSGPNMTASNGAAYSMVEGGFNIFSASTEAWTAFLKNPFKNNSALSIQNNASGSAVQGVFSRLPFASPKISDQLADSAITVPEQRNKLLYRQGIRALDSGAEDQISLLAENIVSEIHSEIASSGSASITSLRDLINSGAIDRAIESVGINGGDDPLDTINPGYLRQSDIFSMLGTQMTTRSDTFVIRAYGDSTHHRSGVTQARAWCEAVVQRYPEYIVPTDLPESTPSEPLNVILGRRFKVVSFRWLQPHEI